MYKDMTENRPTVTEIVEEIAYIGGNGKVLTKEVINGLYKAQRKSGYITMWVDIDYHDDEYGHVVGHTIVVKGERFLTDKEWLRELEHTKARVNNDRERHLQARNYFDGNWYEDMKLFTEKIKELKEKKSANRKDT